MSMKHNFRYLLAVFLLTLTYSLHKQQIRSEARASAGLRRKFWETSSTRPGGREDMSMERSDIPKSIPTVTVDWEDMLTCTDNSSTEIPVTSDVANDTVELELCPNLPPGLGQVGTGESMINIASIQSIYSELTIGGAYKGKQCKARQTVAIIVPFNGLKKHLNPFLYYMHPFLMKQQLEYRIFVIQYSKNIIQDLNRGQLFNIGVLEAQKFRPGGWDCLILHDADLLPLDLRNLYRCSWYPRKMITVTNDSPIKKVAELSGGAISITPELFTKANGFSNEFMERDVYYEDFYNRLNLSNSVLEKNGKLLGNYRIMKYAKQNRTSMGGFFSACESVPRDDGMNTTVYVVHSIKELFFYTSINVTGFPNYEPNMNETSSSFENAFDANLRLISYY